MKGEKRSDAEARAEDLVRTCLHRGYAAGSFLSAEEQAELSGQLSRLSREQKFYYSFEGGAAGSERRVAVLLRSGGGFADCAGIALLRIHTPGDALPDHRTLLGSLLGLGLDRSAIGDIFRCGDFMAVAVKERVAPFICSELTRAGREPVKAEVFSLPDGFEIVRPTEEVQVNVPSLRLDCLVSAICRVSREEAADFIAKGLAQVNHRTVLRPDCKPGAGDLLSLRGKGRYLLTDETHTTRSGRLFVTVLHYI